MISIIAYGAAGTGVGSRTGGSLRWGRNWIRRLLLQIEHGRRAHGRVQYLSHVRILFTSHGTSNIIATDRDSHQKKSCPWEHVLPQPEMCCSPERVLCSTSRQQCRGGHPDIGHDDHYSRPRKAALADPTLRSLLATCQFSHPYQHLRHPGNNRRFEQRPVGPAMAARSGGKATPYVQTSGCDQLFLELFKCTTNNMILYVLHNRPCDHGRRIA